MAKYRKKPIVIEAEQYRPGLEDGFGDRYGNIIISGDDIKIYPFIETLEGRMRIDEGDWIITGIKGEKYPCKPDIFEMTYESVDEVAA